MEDNTTQQRPVADMSYNEAIAELEGILQRMQGDSCDIDRLTAMTRRATELLRECKSRLTATDSELREILDQLEQ